MKRMMLAILCAAACALPASAHHSHVNYAVSDFTIIEGTVKAVHLINPHSWVYIEVKNAKGETEQWSLEATNPRGLETRGIKKDTIKIGDRVKVRCHRQRDGANGCLLGFLTPMHGDASRGHGVEVEWD
ncbi:MAG: DUF6152 family protein [Vicinamibacterales bacterium]